MEDMREHLSLMQRPPVVRERYRSPWTDDADTYPPISELQGTKSKTPEYAMDWHKDPWAPAVGPTGEIDEFAHLTDAQTPAIHTYGFSGFNNPMTERLYAMRETEMPQEISHEFYPEESGMDFRLNSTNRDNKLFRRSSDSPIDTAWSILKALSRDDLRHAARTGGIPMTEARRQAYEDEGLPLSTGGGFRTMPDTEAQLMIDTQHRTRQGSWDYPKGLTDERFRRMGM